jgi:hypothetical protein
MPPSDAMGWLAAGLMLLAFWCTGPRGLRAFALAANVAFILYGLAEHLPPIATLHAMLLPINAFRLVRAMSPAPQTAYSPSAES